MLNKLSLLSIFLFIILGLGCIDPIQFDPPDSLGTLVVEGELTNAKISQRVTLKSLSPYGAGPDIPVGQAEIILISNTGETYNYSEIEEGVYEIPSETIDLQEGDSYHLEIKLGNGEEYASYPEEMPPLFKVDSIYFALEEEVSTSEIGVIVSQKVINIYIDSPIKKGDKAAFFRWKTDDAFSFTELKCYPMLPPRTCYFFKETNPQEVHIFNGKGIENENITNYRVASESFNPDYAYNFRHYFNVTQHSITQEAYEYWKDVDLISNQSGSIFDSPPAAVRGNIYKKSDPSEIVLGYFGVSAVDTARVFTLPIFLAPFRVIPRCPPSFNYLITPLRYISRDCCNCLLLQEGGTYERPDYWGE